MSISSRPGGITLLALAICVFGVILLAGAAELLSATGFVEEYIDLAWKTMGTITNLPPGIDLVALVKVVLTAIAVVLIVLGVVNFPLAWGIYSGKGWAWTFSIIVTVIWIVIGVVTLIAVVGVFILMIAVLILYYLYRPNVKEFFGKGVPRTYGTPIGPI